MVHYVHRSKTETQYLCGVWRAMFNYGKVEQLPHNPLVVGSSPTGPTIFFNYLRDTVQGTTFPCKHYVSTLAYSTSILFDIPAPTIIIE